MAFKQTQSSLTLPTHRQWILGDKGVIGGVNVIQSILFKQEWGLITINGTDFKLNLKYLDGDDYESAATSISKEFSTTGLCSAVLQDCSNEEEGRIDCRVDIQSSSADSDSPEYEFIKGNIRIKRRNTTKPTKKSSRKSS
jgi:hypothetical protein